MNKQVPNRTIKEWCEDNAEHLKEYNKEWHKDNAKHLKAYNKEYRKDNVERIQAYKKAHEKKRRAGPGTTAGLQQKYKKKKKIRV